MDHDPPQPVLSKGVISSLRPYMRSHYMRISAPVPSAFSGGGLFDAHGALVGILSHPVGKGGNVTFVLPADWIGELPIKVQPGPEMTKKDKSAWLDRALALERSADWRGLLKLSQQEVSRHSGNAAAWFTLISRFEIITTSIKPSTTSIMVVSLILEGRGAPSTATASRICCNAA